MTIAVVGASNDPEKYGFRIVKHLVREGHRVLPVNLTEKEVHGIAAYAHLSDISQNIDIVDIVVPPSVTGEIVKQAAELGGVDVWLQPGSESDQVIAYLQTHKDLFGKIVHDACIMHDFQRFYPNTGVRQ